MINYLRAFARWILYMTEPQPSFQLLGLEVYEPTYDLPAPSVLIQQQLNREASIREALFVAMAKSGLPTQWFDDGYNVAKTGKLNDVIHHTAAALGLEHPTATIGDLVRYFLEAR